MGDLWQGRMSSGQRDGFTREDEFIEFYIYRCHRFTFFELNAGRNSTKKNMAMNMDAIIHRFWFSKEEMYTITLEILDSIHWRKKLTT